MINIEDSMVQAPENNYSVQATDSRRYGIQIKVFRCSVCGKICSSKHCLKEHGYTHSNERKYPCLICNRLFKYASQFSNHKKTHLRLKKISWPKLTNLLKKNAMNKFEINQKNEVITLPLVCKPQEFKLPGLDSLINFNF